MYDGFQILILMACVYDQLEKNLSGLVAHASYHNGNVYSLTTIVEGIRVQLKKRLREIVKLDGSLHCFHTKGNNDSLFTYKELVETVIALCHQFGFDPRFANLQRIEIGVNIPIEEPKELIDAAILFSGRVATKRKQTLKHYYKEWRFSEYTVKLYKKGEYLVRFEIRLFKKRQLDRHQLHTLSDLVDHQKFCECLSFLESSASRFVFVPCDNSIVPISIKADLANWRNDSYWRSFNAKNKSTKSRRIVEVCNIINKYGLTDWCSVLMNRIHEQGALMISPEDATFSQLGSLWETVAGPKGDGNRLRDESPRAEEGHITMNYPAQIHYLDAYELWMVGVTISAPSYYPLLPRGPPSVLSIFLLLMYEYNVALLMPVVSSISLIGMVPVSYRASAWLIDFPFALGRPPFLPRARAAASPSIVRSWVRSRSNWLTPAKMVKSSRPCVVVVSSQLSFNDRMLAPMLLIRSTKSNRSFVDRLNRVSSQMTTVSPARSASNILDNSGRSFLVPDTFSW